MAKRWKRRRFYGGGFGPEGRRWVRERINQLRLSKQLAFALDMQARGLNFIYEVRTAGYRADFVVPMDVYVDVLIEHDGPGHKRVADSIRDQRVRRRYKYAYPDDLETPKYGRAVIVRVKQGEEDKFFKEKFPVILKAQRRRNFHIHHFLPVI